MCTVEILTTYYLIEINRKSLNNKSREMNPESYAIRVNFKTFDFMDFRLYRFYRLYDLISHCFFLEGIILTFDHISGNIIISYVG